MIKIRIHHFFDILRHFGDHDVFLPHEYGHSFHTVASGILSNEEFKLVAACDDICKGCKMLNDNECLDTISHRDDFKSKEFFNNYLDHKIMLILGLESEDIMTLKEMIPKLPLYLDNIHEIYSGNDVQHTLERKKSVKRGLEKWVGIGIS